MKLKWYEVGDRILIIAATIYSNKLIEQLLTEEEIKEISHLELIQDFSAPGSEVFLSLEAMRYRFASLDPFLAMSTSKIDPSFQLDAVYLHALKLPGCVL